MASSPDPPKPVDPNVLINAQEQANRINTSGPFGSQTYGPDGFTTSITPGMQHLADTGMAAAGTPLTPLSQPQGFGGIQNNLADKIGQRYSNNNSQKAGQQSMPSPGGANDTYMHHMQGAGSQGTHPQANAQANPMQQLLAAFNNFKGASGSGGLQPMNSIDGVPVSSTWNQAINKTWGG